jgi:hypothetical protein
VSTIEELLGRNSSGSGLGSWEYGRRDPWADHATPSAKFGITSPTSGGRSAGIVRSQTKVTEFSLVLEITFHNNVKHHNFMFKAVIYVNIIIMHNWYYRRPATSVFTILKP